MDHARGRRRRDGIAEDLFEDTDRGLDFEDRNGRIQKRDSRVQVIVTRLRIGQRYLQHASNVRF